MSTNEDNTQVDAVTNNEVQSDLNPNELNLEKELEESEKTKKVENEETKHEIGASPKTKKRKKKNIHNVETRDFINRNLVYIYTSFFFSFIILLSILLVSGVLDLFYDSTEVFQDCKRLPTSVAPENYALEMKVDLDETILGFSGTVNISILCIEATDVVVLNSNRLKIHDKSISLKDKDSNTFIEIRSVYERDQFLSLELGKKLKVGGKYQIYIKYEGMLSKRGLGFFAVPLQRSDGNVQFIASTIFEPDAARTAFPCFDEPEFKATFDITLVRKKDLMSLSNMPKLKTEPRSSNWEADIFVKSMKMSTYLVAFFVGDAIGKSQGNITVWEVRNKSALGNNHEYVLAISKEILWNLQNKLGVKYQSPKIDILSMPEIIYSGMENWGLISIKDYYFLTPLSKDQKSEDIYSVVVHELAHEWFGNLVTMKWWDDVWLNEGTSYYLELLLRRESFPDQEVDELIKIGEENRPIDCSSSLILTMLPPNCDLMKHFTRYIYTKGTIVIRMLHQILGDEDFWFGMKLYLEKYSFGSANELDFWNSFTSETLRKDKINIAEVMSTWTHNGGTPIVTVKRNYFLRNAFLRQESCRSKFSDLYQDDIWYIPITYKSISSKNKKNSTVDFWLKNREKLIYNMPRMNEWILVNGQSLGDYIVNYDSVNMKLLTKQLLDNNSVFTVEERHKIFMDLTYLESSGIRNIKSLLDLYMYLPKESSKEIVYFAIKSPHIASIEYLTNLMEGDHSEHDWNEFVMYLMKPIFRRERLKFKRNVANCKPGSVCSYNFEALCSIGKGFCIREAILNYKMSDDFVKDTLRSTLLCFNISTRKTENFHSEIRIMNNVDVLRCSNDNSEIQSILKNLLEEENANEFLDNIKNILRNRKNWKEFISFLDNYFEEFSKNEAIFHLLVKSIYEIPKNPIKYLEIRKVLSNRVNTLPKMKAENIRLLIEFLKDDSKMKKQIRNVRKWLISKPWTKDFRVDYRFVGDNED
ncbi:endoplasmic reticulum aminopeptidase 2-like isoform X2 [Centruroides sculpturatus]|uniref:endoplasmic reticulum aminopeptidase 2-like isoform X2 n=2 Tax=Centruroides sculpturatus TaxID=218467 RepID=UPI000C6E098F|nr:endoplasmic reticulum aminopeptidase 2-like isoform X2 [Centruroides sculpturatus]